MYQLCLSNWSLFGRLIKKIKLKNFQIENFEKERPKRVITENMRKKTGKFDSKNLSKETFKKLSKGKECKTQRHLDQARLRN